MPDLGNMLAPLSFFFLAAALSAGLLHATWWVAGRPAFLALWTGFCASSAVAGLLFGAWLLAPGQVPEAATIVGTNAALLLGAGLFWAGARRLRDRGADAWTAALAPALWLVACAIPAFFGSLPARAALGTVLYAGLAAAAAVELLRHRPGRVAPLVRVLAGLAGLGGLVHLARPWLTAAGEMPLSISLIAVSTAALFTTAAVVGVSLAGAEAAAREAAALRAGRAQVERLHAGLPAMLFLCEVRPDGGSRRLYWDGDFEGVMGWPRAVLMREDTVAGFAPPGSPRFVDLMGDALRSGSAATEWRMRQPDGSFAWMQTHARRLSLRPDGSGEVVGYTRNITAERAAQDRAIAAARLASLGEMATGLAHEMKQPLTAIAMAAGTAQQALARGDLRNVAARLGWVVDQAMRAGAMIEHHRRFGRGAEPDAPPGPVGLDTVLEGALALVGASLDAAGVRVALALGDPPPAVLGQLIPLQQVLVNLLANAQQAMAALPATAPRRLRIAAMAEGGVVRLSVADTAGGIAPEVMARLFEPFVSTKRPESGTGLGLSICRGLMSGMGGSIAAENGPEGAIFTLCLPAAARPGASDLAPDLAPNLAPDQPAALAATRAAG
jgi:signal transduction histidine kinase